MAWHVFSLLLYRQVVLSFALCKSVHSFEKLVFCGCIIFNSINIPSKGNVPASASSVHEIAWKVVTVELSPELVKPSPASRFKPCHRPAMASPGRTSKSFCPGAQNFENINLEKVMAGVSESVSADCPGLAHLWLNTLTLIGAGQSPS